MDAKVEYEVRLVGQLDRAAREAMGEISVEVKPPMTVLSGTLDQAQLHDVCDRLRALGLEVVDIRQVRHRAVGDHHR